MFTQFLRKSLFSKIMATVVSVGFVLTSVPVSYAYMDKLKPSAAKDDLGGGDIVEKLKERGEEGARGADTGFIPALQHKAVNAVLERLEGRNSIYTVYDIADDHKLTELEPEQIKGKLFFVRGSADVAFTVKLEEKKDFSIDDLYNPKLIADDIRIKAFIPTLKYIIENGGKIVLQPGWIGRPKGKEMAQFSLIPVYLRLKQLLKEEGLLKEEMLMAPNSLGGQIKSVYRNQEEVRKTVATLKEGQIVLLENPRFDPEEDANDEGYAQFLASLADYYVSDCFAQLHRPTGSIKAITKYLPAYMGIQEEGEIRYIRGIREELLKKERKPFIFILAGKKIETGVGIVSKMTVALSLLNNMQPQDKIKVGGAMAYTFMVAANYLDKVKAGMDEVKKITPQDIKGLIGDSFVEWGQIYDQIFIAGQVLLKAAEKKVKISLPSDHLIRNKGTGEIKVVEGLIPEGWYGVDIGTQTINDWVKDIESSGIGVIAGPVGICDDPKIPEATKGTEAMMRALEKIIGISAGGETTEFATRIRAKLTFESKGGGSTLELIEKGTLVGYNALLNDGFGIIHIQAVPGMTEAIRAELKKLGETRDIFIRGHYPIRLVEEGKDPPISHTYIYVDKDAYDKKLVEHEIGEVQETRKSATRDKEKLWTTRDRGKVWTLNELVEWLEIKGDPKEVEAFLNQRHKEAPPLPEGAKEFVGDLPPRVMLAKERPKTKVAINGFGRIGKLFFKASLDKDNRFEVVAVNDLAPIKTLAHLFEYDSTFGRFKGEVRVEGDNLIINGQRIKVLNEKDPTKLPWKDLGIEYVIEATGSRDFRKREGLNKHLEAGAKKVVLTAPGEGEDLTVVLGVDEDNYDPEKDQIISNASCTTNCLAPVIKALRRKFTVVFGRMTTTHSYTNDQRVLDGPHEDLRRARTTGRSMIPTTTGAAKAISLVIPELKGKLSGAAVRVPTDDVSAVDLTIVIKGKVTVEEVNAALKEAAEDGYLGKFLGYTEKELVSVDFLGNPKSGIVDSKLTEVLTETVGTEVISLVRVFAWYDNEWGYSNRTVDLVNYMLGREEERPVRGAAAEDVEPVFPNKIPIGGKSTTGGNWKLRPFKTEEEARAKAREFKAKFADVDKNAEIVLFVEDKWMKAISEELEGSIIKVGVQSFHFDPKGNIKEQIEDAVNNGAKYAMVGHSMHRYPNEKQFPPGGETKMPEPLANEGANKIARAILEDGQLKLWYVIAINDKPDQIQPLAEQEDQIKQWIFDAINIGLDGVSIGQLSNMIITAEPMSAISTAAGDGKIDPKTYVDFARVEMLTKHSTEALRQKFGITREEVNEKVNMGYGATAGPGTAAKLLSDPRISKILPLSNILPGGMSLEADNFRGTVVNAIIGKYGSHTAADVELAQKLNVEVGKVRRALSLNKSAYTVKGGAAFSGYTTAVASNLGDKPLALIVTPDCFRMDGMNNTLKELEKLGSGFKIALYGEVADKLKAWVGNKDIVTAKSLDDVLEELIKRGIDPEDMVLLKTKEERVERIGLLAEVRVISGDIATLAVAKAVKELVGNTNAEVAFKDFLSAIEGKVIEKLSDRAKENIVKKIEGLTYAFPEELKMTDKVTKDTEGVALVTAEVLDI